MHYILILLIIALDRVSKILALKYLSVIDTHPLIKNIFHLTYRENTGAAFSMLSGKRILLVGFTAVAISVMIFVMEKARRKGEHWLFTLSLSMIIGGAIGNLIDRATLGYVIDYFDFRLINFAVFNVADSFISVGAVLLGISVLFEEKLKGSKGQL